MLDSNPRLPYNRQVNHLKEDDVNRLHDFHHPSSVPRLSLLLLITHLSFLTFLFALPAFSQQRWQRTYGGTNYDDGYSTQQTSDGGYIVAGYTYSFGAGQSDVYLIRTNGTGDTLWTRAYGGTSYDEGYTVRQTQEGGYIIAGETNSFGAGSYDVYLIKTNGSGDTLWTKTYGGTNTDAGNSVQQTLDGGYIVVGYSYSFGIGLSDVYLIKTNVSGDTLWTRTYGGANFDCGFSVQQTSDGGYIIAGSTSSFGAGYDDVYLIKTNASGDTLWTRTYGGTSSDEGLSVQQTSDGGYIIAGPTTSFGAGSFDAYLIKTNASGDTLWTRTYGGVGDDEGYSVQQTTDGGYIIVGPTTSFGAGGYDVYLIKTNTSGDTLWTRTYGGTDNEWSYSVQQTSDRGYIIAGYTRSFGAGGADVYLIKTDGNGNVGTERGQGLEGPRGQGITITPNPFIFFARVPGHEAERFSLYDISGRKVGTYRGDRIGEGLTPGVYFLKPEGGEARPLRIVKIR